VRCPHMNEITLEQTLAALEQTRYQVEVHEDIRARAFRAVQRMISIG
jgi:quinolinate synthase